MKAKRYISFLLVACALFSTACTPPNSSDDTPVTQIQNKEPLGFRQAVSDEKPIMLVENKNSDYKIVVPQNATLVESYAAQELRDWLEESTACRLNIITDEGITPDNTQAYLSVGNTTLLQSQTDIVLDYEVMGETGPSIYTKDRTVYMAGAADYGTLYSVYKFLYYEIAFEAFATDYVYYEPHATLPLYQFDYHYVPSIKGPVNTSLTVGNHMLEGNVYDMARMYGYGGGGGGVSLNGKLYAVGCWTHTTFNVLPPSKYQGEHPDWYGNDQLCYSNEEMTQEYIEVFKKYLIGDKAPYAMIGHSDVRTSCSCKDCNESYAKYNGGGGVYVQFLNKVAEAIEKWLQETDPGRELKIVGLAYYAYENAPVKKDAQGNYVPIDETVVCRDNVSMMYTPLDACFAHPFGDNTCERNENVTENYKGWSVLTDELATYCYTSDFQDFQAYFNNWNWFQGSARFFESVGVEYVYLQGDGSNAMGPFDQLKLYLITQHMWNASRTTEELVDRFMKYYYQEGAAYMKEFYLAIREQGHIVATKKKTDCVGIYDNTVSNTYGWTRNTFVNMENLLEKAKTAVEQGNKPETIKEVIKERIYREYLLTHWQNVVNNRQYYPANVYEVEMSNFKAEFAKYGIKNKTGPLAVVFE